MLCKTFMCFNLTFLRCVHSSRIFKVLKGNIDFDENLKQNILEKSNQANQALKALSEISQAGGGNKGIHRHTVVNKKLLVRHRLKLLFDEDSPLLEIGLLAGIAMDYGTVPAAGSVVAIGKIHGKYCIVGANDATVKGGTFFPISIKKQIRAQNLAYLNKLPCIYLVDSGGAYLPLQGDIFPDRDHGGRTFYNEAILSSKNIPQIALVCGSSTAGGAYCPTMAEEALMVNKSGVIFLAGPPLVKAATGEIVSEQELGGAEMHCSISGCTDYFAKNEEEAFEMCRESVSTLNIPNSSRELSYQEPLYSAEELSLISGKSIISKQDMYLILSRILDESMFKEFKAKFGSNLITGFGFIHGILVGIIANNNFLTIQDAQKGAHFIQICDKRLIPLIFLQNSGSSLASNEIDDYVLQSCILKDRSKMIAAHSCANVPKIVICIKNCFGDDNFTMCGWSFEPNFFFSWPLAHISLSREESEKDMLAQQTLLKELYGTKIFREYERLCEHHSSAFYKASQMTCDGIIFPQDTRKVLALCLDVVTRNLSSYGPSSKNIAILRM